MAGVVGGVHGDAVGQPYRQPEAGVHRLLDHPVGGAAGHDHVALVGDQGRPAEQPRLAHDEGGFGHGGVHVHELRAGGEARQWPGTTA